MLRLAMLVVVILVVLLGPYTPTPSSAEGGSCLLCCPSLGLLCLESLCCWESRAQLLREETLSKWLMEILFINDRVQLLQGRMIMNLCVRPLY